MSIPDAPWVRKYGHNKVLEFTSPEWGSLPWESAVSLPEKRVQYYKIHLGCAKKSDVVKHVVRSITPRAKTDRFQEDRLSGMYTSLGTLTIDWKGRVVAGSLRPSTFVLGCYRLKKKESLGKVPQDVQRFEDVLLGDFMGSCINALDGEVAISNRIEELESSLATKRGDDDSELTEEILSLIEALKAQCIEVSKNRIDLDLIFKVSNILTSFLGYQGDTTIRVEEVRRHWRDMERFPRPPGGSRESFLFDELNRISENVVEASSSKPLRKYLCDREGEASRKEVVESDDCIAEILSLDRLPLARWPAPLQHRLNLGQQIAVSEALDGGCITSVNGPPGTGKTTLLREVIANHIFKRALKLTQVSDPAKGFIRMPLGEGDVPVARPDLVVGSGIVVVSNSNAAVENISRELPLASSIDRNVFRDAKYLPAVADEIASAFGDSNADSWGLISAPMGKKSNTDRVMSVLCGKELDEGEKFLGLKRQLESCGPVDQDEWRRACDTFRKAIFEFEKCVEKRQSNQTSGVFTLDDLFSLGSPAERHSKSIWLDDEIEAIRSRLFLMALDIHSLFLRKNAGRLDLFVRAFCDVISGEQEADDHELVSLWNTFFLVIPVISTTFVSMQRFPIEAEWIGCLLVDEAGQATPQSVIPSLQRASKAIIVGDPLQLEPIVSVPSPVIEAIREKRKVPYHLSPVRASVQTIADGTMSLGSRIDAADEHSPGVWTGLPLRVHRRCAEPMFSISNRMSYNCQMVHGSNPADLARSYNCGLGRSSWRNVSGSPFWRGCRAIKEEIDDLEEQLGLLRDSGYFSDPESKVIIISPFSNVRSLAAPRVRKILGNERASSVSVGTIHQFQGREADIVFLVLGSQPGRAGQLSREWAGSGANMLNVAVTRARRRLYVIGNFDDWQSIPFFCDMARIFKNAGALVHV